ncbi:DUF465 domain-containing protein [Roseovarius sp. SCSIO 43702]|uniref:DUF465 domain-containing protein n=1 Tax=Roseovarius sp. SCSIO 43702 TaxID=2823043 RepID=UPI001C730534|nr:DUF465 domain-containing protein [Roseovarius sp. SCSIO 43702]QYX57332.1 DUF465 domain-containing protein [Roseovarius sp. SCSIO 43702]
MPNRNERIMRRIEALRQKRVALKDRIQSELRSPLPDWQKLRALKAARLRLKDMLASCHAARRGDQGEPA